MSTRAVNDARHIAVCICSFKRETLLKELLTRLSRQQTAGLFTFSVVVADNDSARSAQGVVDAASSTGRVPLTYCCEPEKNIALVRNRAVSHAEGDLIAFIDDDEFPDDDWLRKLFETYVASGADGVLGPVKAHFDVAPPPWMIKGRFFERPSYPTGHTVPWYEARTGNVLFTRDIIDGVDAPFRAEFGTAGEDVDFFRRMMEQGHIFVWCEEAVVHELVPSSRASLSYLLQRAVLRGSNFPKHPRHRFRNAMKSVIAVPCYVAALPVLAMFGRHVFVAYLIKLLDHTSRLLAFLGLPLVTTRRI